MEHSGDILISEIDPDEVDAALYATRSHEFDPVRQGESKKGGWSGFADMLTGQADSNPGPQATLERATVVTVRFGITPPSVGSGAGVNPYPNTVHCIATIVSGVEGQWVQRAISVCLGASISVTADNVQVSFQDATVITDPDTPSDLPYRVTCQITRGVRASFLTPPTLFAFTDIVDSVPVVTAGVVPLVLSGNARYPIPPNAGVVSCEVVATAAVGITPEVTVIAVGGTMEMKAWNPIVNTGFIALPPNATFIEIANDSNANPVNITVTWGIEG